MDNVMINVIIYIITIAIGCLTNAAIRQRKKNNATQLGVKALLRNGLISVYEKYSDKGFFPLYARTNFEEMFKEYTNLNGNGVVKDLQHKLYKLPIKEKEVKWWTGKQD